MKICSDCGNAIREDAVNCSYCGHNVYIEEVMVNDPMVNKVVSGISRIAAIVTGIPLLLIGFVLFIFGFLDCIDRIKYTEEGIAHFKEFTNCTTDESIKRCDAIYNFNVDGIEYKYTMYFVAEEELVNEVNILYNKNAPTKNIYNSDGMGIILVFGLIMLIVGIGCVTGKFKVGRIKTNRSNKK